MKMRVAFIGLLYFSMIYTGVREGMRELPLVHQVKIVKSCKALKTHRKNLAHFLTPTKDAAQLSIFHFSLWGFILPQFGWVKRPSELRIIVTGQGYCKTPQ